MSGRRERPLSGRVYLPAASRTPRVLSARSAHSSARPEVASARQLNPENDNGHENSCIRPYDATFRPPSSGRSEESAISTSEMLRRMKTRQDLPLREREGAEAEALGNFSAFSRPIPSLVTLRCKCLLIVVNFMLNFVLVLDYPPANSFS
jgi:hypothetical protein